MVDVLTIQLGTVIVFEVALVLLLLRARPRRSIHTLMAALLGLNAVQAGLVLFGHLAHAAYDTDTSFLGLDFHWGRITILTDAWIALVLLRAAWIMPEARRRALPPALLVAAMGLLVVSALPRNDLVDRALGVPPIGTLRDLLFVAALAVIALSTVPRVLALPAGPLRGRSLLIMAGIGIALIQQHIPIAWVIGQDVWLHPGREAGAAIESMRAAGLAGAALAGAMLSGWLVWRAARAARDGNPDSRLLFVVFLAGLAVGVVRVAYLALNPERYAPWFDIIPQYVRPTLIGYAIVRYEPLRLSENVTRAVYTALSLFGGFGAFFIVVANVARSSLSGGELGLLTVFVSLGLAAMTVGFMQPLVRTAALHAAGHGDAGRRRERYLLALQANEPSLPALRLRLGISLREHEAMANATRRGGVPSWMIRGLEAGDVLDQRIEILEPLGAGGEGSLFKARDLEDGAMVVVKEPHQPFRSDRERAAHGLRSEAMRAAARGLGGQIVHHGWRDYLVRPYIDGMSMEERLRSRRLEIPAVRRLAADIQTQVEQLHAQGLAHGDIKPSNIIMTADGGAVLIDDAPPVEGTRTGVLHATPDWMAPETTHGTAGMPADVYQVGKVLHALGAGSDWTTAALSPDPADRPDIGALDVDRLESR